MTIAKFAVAYTRDIKAASGILDIPGLEIIYSQERDNVFSLLGHNNIEALVVAGFDETEAQDTVRTALLANKDLKAMVSPSDIRGSKNVQIYIRQNWVACDLEEMKLQIEGQYL